jgi:ParB family chromosome partitioning protein
MDREKSRTEAFGAASRGQTFSYYPEDLVLVTDEDHPLYDERVHKTPKESLIRGIMRQGVIVPVVIRKNGVRKNGKAIMEVVDGRQRVKATIEANRRLKQARKEPILVPTVCRRSDDGAAITCMVMTNEHRIQDDIVTRAEKLKRYLERGYSEKDAKLAFGMGSRELAKYRKVMDMGQELKDALQAKKITMDIAGRLSDLPRQEQSLALQQVFEGCGGNGRGRKANEAAEKATGKKTTFRPRTTKAMLNAIDTVAECLAANDYRKGVLDALEWSVGKRDAAWAERRENRS